jgi:hypothetical protein
VDGISRLFRDGHSVELVILVHSCDEDIDARGVAEPVDAGLNEALTEVLCKDGVAVNSDESKLGRVPSVEIRVIVSILLKLLVDRL